MQFLRVKVLCSVILLVFVVSFVVNAKNVCKKSERKTKHTVGNITAFEDRIVNELLHYSETDIMTQQLNNDLQIVGELKDLPKEPYNMVLTRKHTVNKHKFKFCALCRIVVKALLVVKGQLGWKKFVYKSLMKICLALKSKTFCTGILDLNITPSNKPLRILHITDIHYDYKYKAASNTNCGEPLCCGVDQGKPKSPDLAAGVWGDYRSCDMPLYAVENLMDESSKHNVDFIYHTGDIIHHRVWETSKQTNTKNIVAVNELFRTKFPNKKIYHIAGNHEPNPLDVFAPEHITHKNLSTHWLHNLLAEEWSTWLPKETQQSIRKGGYYTVLVRPGFRIIALNSNVCYVYNWWLLYNAEDPYGQLQWLSDTLYQAELHGEMVHILSHIPSGDKKCYKKWSHEYNRIIRRYADIIKAQFVGHTHFNELHLFYEDDLPNNKHPINVAFNGGCFTTFENVNPNYRIYEVNPETYEVEDYADWIYNITAANKYDRSVPPKWYKLYSFKEVYGFRSMNLPELGKFVRLLVTNSTHLDTYYRLKVSDGDASLKKGCDQKCKEEQVCNLVTSEFGAVKRCEKLLSEYRQTNFFKLYN